MQKYTDEFKLHVVKTYLESPHGVRVVAKSFNLPTKNYIHNWMKQLKEKGLLDVNATKQTQKSKYNPSSSNKVFSKSPRERQLELENEELRAEIALLKKLEELQRGNAPKN